MIKDFLQRFGIDYSDIFSPIVLTEMLRFLLALAAAMDWDVEQLDFNMTFLNGFLSDGIYVNQPVGFKVPGRDHLVCKLIKS